MINKDAFSGFHPAVNLLYFVLAVGFTMFFMHYICIIISLFCALAYLFYLSGRRAARFALAVMLPMFVLAALINPAFSHAGATILTYLPGGNPLTLESILYGVAAGATLVAVVAWFGCVNEVMTSDKLVYLFGRVLPALSLLLSMTLRFVPRFSAQIKQISAAQKCVGRDASRGGIIQRARNGVTILSIMVTWALESAIETADSMKSRGYGLRGRSAFSIYRFDRRDRMAALFLLICGAYVIIGGISGALYWRYYPVIKGEKMHIYSVSVFAAYFALMFAPPAINLLEDRKWKSLQSES